jgi:hypothetical protein
LVDGDREDQSGERDVERTAPACQCLRRAASGEEARQRVPVKLHGLAAGD